MILTFMFLMIDRAVLIPAVWMTSHSVYELQKLPDRYSMYSIMRVGVAVIIALIIWILTLIF